MPARIAKQPLRDQRPSAACGPDDVHTPAAALQNLQCRDSDLRVVMVQKSVIEEGNLAGGSSCLTWPACPTALSPPPGERFLLPWRRNTAPVQAQHLFIQPAHGRAG